MTSGVDPDALRTGFVRILAIGILLVFTLVMAKVLGANGYGVFAYIWSWLIVLATITAMGTDVLVVREISRSDGRSGVVAWSVKLILVASALVVLATFSLRHAFAIPSNAPAEAGFHVMLACIPLMAFVRLLQGMLQAHALTVQSQLPQFIFVPVLTLFCAIVFSLSGHLNVATAMASMLLALIGSLVWATWYYRSNVQWRRPANDVASGAESSGWLIGTVALGGVAVASIGNEQIGVLILGGNGFTESAGAFDIIRKMAFVVSLGLMMVNVPLAPSIARKLTAGDVDDLQTEIRSGVRFAFAVALIIALLILVFGKTVLGLLNPQYTDVYPALAILVGGQLLNVASGPVWLILNMAGLVRYAAIGLIAGVGVNVAVSLLLVQDYGVIGVAAGTVAGLVIWNGVQLYFVRTNLTLNPSIS